MRMNHFLKVSPSSTIGSIQRRLLQIHVSNRVKQALAEGKPVVALESTIISHGMPYPRNLQIAKQIEQAVTDNGAIPATIAVLNGIPCIGLEENQFEILANKDKTVVKASTRDLAFVCNQQLNASTTVASTMRLASLAGIHVFATGGIGGVHRGAEKSMDISSDLIELGRIPVTVVCSGIKSILDIPKSLEVLETQGVPVFGYQTREFPAFFTRSSGVNAHAIVHSTKDIANMIRMHQELKIDSGIVVAVPNPNPLDAEFIDSVIASALLEAERQNIQGAKITPFLLNRIEQLSKGQSLESNISLVLNNAKIAAEISVHLANQAFTHSQAVTRIIDLKSAVSKESEVTSSDKQLESQILASAPSLESRKKLAVGGASDVMVVGGAVVDIIGKVTSSLTIAQSSNPGVVRTSLGGVGRNITEQLARLGVSVSLNTAVGKDESGRRILEDCAKLNIDTSTSLILDSNPGQMQSREMFSTARYTAIHDNTGELVIGIADMDIFHQLDPSYMKSLEQKVSNSKIVICDGNISKEGFASLAKICEDLKKPLFFEPTSDHKCLLPLYANSLHKITLMKPNITELVQIINYALQQGLIKSGKAMVSTIVANVVASRIDTNKNAVEEIDISDVRILASTLLKLLYDHQKFKYTNTKANSSSLLMQETSGQQTIIHGKHIFVSMGKRGVVWCCPNRLVSSEDKALLNQLKPENVVVSGDEDYPTLTAHIPVEEIASEEMKYSSNGAGDAFCAGLVYGILHGSGHLINKSPSHQTTAVGNKLFPNYSNIKMGLLNSKNWILRK